MADLTTQFPTTSTQFPTTPTPTGAPMLMIAREGDDERSFLDKMGLSLLEFMLIALFVTLGLILLLLSASYMWRRG